MRWHPWASVLLVASAKTRKPREVKPRPLATLPALPHCRDVEVIHVPKTGGTALIRSLARADVDVCYSETWIADGGCGALAAGAVCCRRRGGWRTAPSPCAGRGAGVGVHERAFGATAGRAATLYVAVVRRPKDWLRSALAETCATAARGDAACAGADAAAFRKFYDAPPQYYYRWPNLQAKLVGELFQARNWAVAALERRGVVLAALGAAVGAPLADARAHARNASGLPWAATFDGAYASTFRDLYHLDEALYAHVARAGGVLSKLDGRAWRDRLAGVLGPSLAPG